MLPAVELEWRGIPNMLMHVDAFAPLPFKPGVYRVHSILVLKHFGVVIVNGVSLKVAHCDSLS